MTERAFSGLHFWVRDMEATIAFYRLVGLAVPDAWQGEFVNFELQSGLRLAVGTYVLTLW
jgi:hypothetical protein